MSSIDLQSRINPPQTATKNFELSAAPVTSQPQAQDSTPKEQVDFRALLQNSNDDTTRERGAKKSGDLSGAKTDEEFFKMLNEKANPVRTPKNQMGKDDFLKLFVAQMQHQDPLNPQDNSEMASQLAQFNSLEQMMNVNKTLEDMVKVQTTDRAFNMVNYLGKEVSLSNGALKFDGKKVTEATFKLDMPVSDAALEVRNGAGVVVALDNIGNLMAGEHPVTFSGKGKDGAPIPPGVYSFNVLAKGMDGNAIPVQINSKVKISGLDLKDEGGAFYTDLGKIRIKDVAAVGNQGFSSPAKPDDKTIPVVAKAGTEDPTAPKQVPATENLNPPDKSPSK